jgi:hypothetical protein
MRYIGNKGHDVHVLHQHVQGLCATGGPVQAAEHRRHVRLPYGLEDLDDGREVDFLCCETCQPVSLRRVSRPGRREPEACAVTAGSSRAWW